MAVLSPGRAAGTSDPQLAGPAAGQRKGPAGGQARIVTIVGASGQVGAALAGRLATEPVVARAAGRGDDLRAAFAGAETVVHLAGALRPRHRDGYLAANLGTVAATCAALAGSAVRQVLFLSFPGAAPGAANPYLRYKGEAEQLLAGSGVPALIFRTAHICGPPARPGPTAAAMRTSRGGTVRVLGPGTQRYAWVMLGDVVEALACAILAPAVPAAPAGRFSLAGPDAWPVDEFVRRVNPPPVRIRHVPGWAARALALVRPGLPGPLAGVMAHDCLPETDPAVTARQFGFTLHRLAEFWPAPAGAGPGGGESLAG